MIHFMIQTERRKAPRELAIAVMDQLHTMGTSVSDLASPQIIYAAEWDGVSSTITVLKGNIADLKMAYLGWPMTT